MEVAIIGGGNFGTAIANIVAANGHTTHLWMRDVEQAQEVARRRENRRYLPGHPLAAASEHDPREQQAGAGAVPLRRDQARLPRG